MFFHGFFDKTFNQEDNFRLQGLTVNEEDKRAFLDDFKNADINQKLDMWYYALEQDTIWEEIISEIADIAQMDQMKKAGVNKVAEEE